MSFAHLHVHTQYSILDGQSKISDLLKTADADGQPAIAITDHGNMFGVKEFIDTAKKLKVNLLPVVKCMLQKGAVQTAKGVRTRVHTTLSSLRKICRATTTS